jgi:hypothetical protein
MTPTNRGILPTQITESKIPNKQQRNDGINKPREEKMT